MKTSLFAFIFFFVYSFASIAQIPFDSGSDGSDGALNITVDTTLTLPPDGIFNYTTIDIAAGATLDFVRNDLNTSVYLLATGDVNIDGTIDVSGTFGDTVQGGPGGPGGFDGGKPGFDEFSPGDGKGPGAGKVGNGGSGSTGAGAGSYGGQPDTGVNSNDGSVYGTDLLIPLIGGSGGAGINTTGLSGGGGGGAILIASSTKITVNGIIYANGGPAAPSQVFNGGSGGAIRLVTPEVTGTGTLRVNGINGNLNFDGSSGGYGRIRVDAINRDGIPGLNFLPNALTPSIGGVMVVFPNPLPRLDITEVAGTTIPEGTGSGVTINLPIGTDPNQDVIIQGRDFTGLVDILVTLTPDNGDAVTATGQLDFTSQNPATATINMPFPTNVQTQVHVWTE